MEAADQHRPPIGSATAKSGQFMGGIAPIAEKDERSVGKPVQQYPHQLAGQQHRALVPPPLGPVQRLGPKQHRRHRQRPGPRNEGELYHHGHYDPAVA
jgi:hypothetical protein